MVFDHFGSRGVDQAALKDHQNLSKSMVFEHFGSMGVDQAAFKSSKTFPNQQKTDFLIQKFNDFFFDVEKWNVGNRLKRVFPKFRADRSHPRGVNGRLKIRGKRAGRLIRPLPGRLNRTPGRLIRGGTIIKGFSTEPKSLPDFESVGAVWSDVKYPSELFSKKCFFLKWS